MKLFKLLIIFFGLGLLPSTADAATINVKVVGQAGKPLANIPVSCASTPPKIGNQLPPPPQWGNLTTNSSGQASWTTKSGEGYKHKCYVAFAITPDSCYSFPTGSGDFTMGSDETKLIVLTGIPQPNTCGVKVPETKAEALTHPYGSQKVNPEYPLTSTVAKPSPKPTINPTASPLIAPPSPSSTTVVTGSTPIGNPNFFERITIFLKKLFLRS